MSNSNNVSTAKPKVGGALWVAPLGTTLPVDATAALSNAFKSLGHISEDGLTNGNEKSVGEIKAWGGEVVDTFQESKNVTFTYKLIEGLSVEVLKEIYGDGNVETQSDGTIKISDTYDDSVAKVYVFDMVVKGGRAKRVIVPNGKLDSVGDVNYKDNEAIGYDCTLKALSYVDGNKTVSKIEYIEKEKNS